MGDSQESGGVDIASRIKQFSSANKKPNPQPRRRPQTTEISFSSSSNEIQSNFDRNSVTRSSSSPLARKKPLIPAKPNYKSPSPTPRSKLQLNNKNINENENNNNNIINDKNQRTVNAKPAIPNKPKNILSPTDSSRDNKALVREKSWKQVAGPPRSPLPALSPVSPFSAESSVKQSKTKEPCPPKPLRGQKMEVYENNDLDPANRIVSSRSEKRRETLDGQMILGGPVLTVSTPQHDDSYSNCKPSGKPARPTPPKFKRFQSNDDADEDVYDYTYQPSINMQRRYPPSPSTQNNEYDQADPQAVQDFMASVNPSSRTTQQQQQKQLNANDSDEGNYDDPEECMYQDSDSVNFKPPIPINHFSRTTNAQTSDSDDQNYDDPEEYVPRPDSDDDDGAYQDPDQENFLNVPITRKPQLNDQQSTDDELYQNPEDIDFSSPPSIKNNKSRVKKRRDSHNDDDDYEEPPPDARAPPIPAHRSKQEDFSSDDDLNEYDFPDNQPPLVPQHKTSTGLPPPVTPHKKKSDTNSPHIPENSPNLSRRGSNNLGSSSSDDDDYNDPENFFVQPPVIMNIRDQSSRIASLNRAGMQPLDYIPASTIQPALDDDDDDLYCDPESTFSSKPPVVRGKSSEGDDIYSDEPLYQVYNAEVLEEYRRESKKKDEDERPLSTNFHLTDDLMHKGSTMRILWSELPSVRKSGFLDTLSSDDRKRQEAMFEVITSEASYLKSLDILVSHFMLTKDFLPNPNLPATDESVPQQQILDRQQYHFLFSGISAIKGVSERFLKDLRRRQQSSVVINSVSDILLEYAENHLQCYVKYCSNQVFQDRTFQALLASNAAFCNILLELEKDPITQGLSLQSFLTLPMQRITRLPLLVDAICRRCVPGSEEFVKTDNALKAFNKLGKDSNEGARQMERTEEMYFIHKNLVWKTKPIPLISATRWLVKKGGLMCLPEEGRFSQLKNQFRHLFKGKHKPIYLFLFTDVLLVTKMKSDEQFKVIDSCQRSLIKCEVLPNIANPEPPRVGTLGTLHVNPLKYAFTLILLENSSQKTVDYHCFCQTETEITRWIEAFNPPKNATTSVEGESIYEEWDCPQVQVIHPYIAQQSDELTLIQGDTISVVRKLPDGWAEGMRLRDDERGWFPINHTDEIDSRHMRAKNLMQRYRLINASKNVIDEILGR